MYQSNQRLSYPLTIFVMLLFLIVGCQDRSAEQEGVEIRPPFPQIVIDATDKVMDPAFKQTANLKGGLSIDIPENAFVDKDGNVVTDSVTISVEHYASTAEIIASGIPMTYGEGGNISNFESAGMFKISGTSKSGPVYVREDKQVFVNYSSQTYGDFDLYFFDENEGGRLNKRGSWKRLTENQNSNLDSQQVVDLFRLQFDTTNYPELDVLSDIDWQLATSHHNPNADENQWVLSQKWASIQIAQPKYGIATTLLKTQVNHDDYLKSGAIVVTEDKSRIITSQKPITRVWDSNGQLLKEIDKVRDDYHPVEIFDDQYMIVEREGGDYLYDLNGNEICRIDKSYNRHIDSEKRRIVYNNFGEIGHIVIKDFKGQTIKDFQLENEGYVRYGGILTYFDVTPNGTLITNSIEGVQTYDLDGNLLNSLEGEYHSFSILEEGILILQEVAGTLTKWNYGSGEIVNTELSDFDLSTRRIERNIFFSDFQPLEETDYILIHEANAEYSKLWNHKLNKTIELPFRTFGYRRDFWSKGLFEGYDPVKQEYHLYDFVAQKDIIVIPGLQVCFNCDFANYPSEISPNHEFVLINEASYGRLYRMNGELVRDFKQLDSLTITSDFITDSTFFTLTSDNTFRIWNTEGEELSQRVLKNETSIYGWGYQDMVVTYTSILRSQKFHDLQGELLYTIPQGNFRRFMDSTTLLHLNHNQEAILSNSFELEPNMYQLILGNEGKSFVTYIYLSEQQLRQINRYLKFRTSRIDEEEDRRNQELQVRRSFRMSEFGIYNWDKLINNIGFSTIAAEFDFDTPLEYNDVRVFHITEIEGKVVIEYGKSGSNNFSFDKNSPNKLLAVLPGQKVALFSEDDFRQLDYQVIRNTGRHTFQMKVQPDSIQNLSQLTSLLSDTTPR